jgi:hypothetical protein
MDRSTLSSLSASDAAVALRSLGRRYREAFRPGELAGADDAIDVRAHPPSGGPSPRELVQSATRALAALGPAVERALTDDRPTLDPSLLDRAVRDRPPGGGADEPVTSALDRLAAAADRLAARVERAPLADSGRPAVVGGETLPVIELVREAVATGRTYLDQLEHTLAELRRSTD